MIPKRRGLFLSVAVGTPFGMGAVSFLVIFKTNRRKLDDAVAENEAWEAKFPRVEFLNSEQTNECNVPDLGPILLVINSLGGSTKSVVQKQ